MRLVIDLQSCQTNSRFRGVGRYSFAISQEIIKANHHGENFILLNGNMPESIPPIIDTFSAFLPSSNIVKFYGPTGIYRFRGTWREKAAKLLREALIANLNPDYVLLTSLIESSSDENVISANEFTDNFPTAIIHYDVIPLKLPATYLNTPAIKSHYLFQLDYLKKVSKFLSISEYSKEDAIETLGIPRDKVESVSSAVDSSFKQNDYDPQFTEGLHKNLGITKKFILYTGGFDARKNINRMLDAFASIPAQLLNDYQLVVVGKMSSTDRYLMSEKLKQLGTQENQVVLTDYIDDDTLIFLYNQCSLFVFPSLYEGFGLPVLEAMSCGAPAIGARNSSIIEIIRWDDAMFDATDVNAIAQKMILALTDDNYRKRLIDNSKIQAAKFSWEKSGQRAYEVMADDLRERQSVPQKLGPDEVYKRLIDKLSLLDNNGKLLKRKDLVMLAELIQMNGIMPASGTSISQAR